MNTTKPRIMHHRGNRGLKHLAFQAHVLRDLLDGKMVEITSASPEDAAETARMFRDLFKTLVRFLDNRPNDDAGEREEAERCVGE